MSFHDCVRYAFRHKIDWIILIKHSLFLPCLILCLRCDMHRIQRLGTEEIEKREKKESRDFRLEPKIEPVFCTNT